MAIKPLTVAVVAGILLVVSIGVDASVNRTFAVEVKQPDGWHFIAGDRVYQQSRAAPTPYGGGGLTADPNGTITLRVRLDNGYPWAFGGTARLVDQTSGAVVGEQRLDVPARSDGNATFAFAAKPYFDRASRAAAPGEKAVPGSAFADLRVEIGGKTIYCYLSFTEASA